MCCFTLPNSKNFPTCLPKLCYIPPVSLHILSEFFNPEVSSSLGSSSIRAVLMSVPEATMNKDNSIELRQHNIRTSRKTFLMEPKTKTIAMKEASNQNFWFSIFTMDSTHVPASLLFCERINHLINYLNSIEGEKI